MDNPIVVDEGTLKFLLEKESNKLVGKVCKRFELTNDKEDIKKNIKEIIHEWVRDLKDSILLISKQDGSIHLTNIEETNKKEGV